jgi:hypothetical protein
LGQAILSANRSPHAIPIPPVRLETKSSAPELRLTELWLRCRQPLEMSPVLRH